MRIQANTGMSQNGIHMERFNQKLASGQEHQNNDKVGERRDKVSLGRQSKGNSFLQSMMEQKQSIMDQKNRLIGRTLEKGGSMESIKSELDMYEEQMKNLDQQIAETMTKETEKQTDKMEDGKKDQPKTKEEAQQEQMINLSKQAAGVEQMEIMDSAQSKMEGEVRVMKAEIATGNGPIECKLEKISELEARSHDLTEKIGDVIQDVEDTAVPDNIEESVETTQEAQLAGGKQESQKAENAGENQRTATEQSVEERESKESSEVQQESYM